AVGKNVDLPQGVRVVDYGDQAVLVPGLVAADSSLGSTAASPRTAAPDLRAIDGFDPYSDVYSALMQGVTTTYLAPARGRLIAGQGAAVKTYGEPGEGRVVAESTGLHGSISSEARRTPGFWEPPVPATVDVGLGVEAPQLPRSTMGAIVALDELMTLAQGGEGADHYGPTVGPLLKEMVEAKALWRLGAEEAGEVRALLEFCDRHSLNWVLDGGRGLPGGVAHAEALAKAGVPVLIGPPLRGGDFGKSEDAAWPRYDVAAALMEAGVRVALTPGPSQHPRNLRMAAQLVAHGDLSAADLLRAITLTPAEVLGIADRVGSIAPGKDADFAVFSGDPLSPGAAVTATWVAGEVAWKAEEDGPVVLDVQELHLGNGLVMSPGQILIQGGSIREVGTTVAHPPGAVVVKGYAAMPGMIDAYGYLGLEGSTKKFSARTDLTRLLEPGDFADRQVAKSGITTVNMGSRSEPGKKGSPTMVYRPAAEDFDDLVIAYPAIVHVQWTDRIRVRAGEDVKALLQDAAEYKQKWQEYEKELAAWTPPAPEADDKDDEDKDDDAKEGDKDDDKSKKKKKKKDKAVARPVTGVWVGHLALPDAAADAEGVFLRLRLLDEDGQLQGNLRCSALSSSLLEISGTRTELAIELSGLGTEGKVTLTLELDEEKLTGKAELNGTEHDVEVEQTEKEYVVAKRTIEPRAEAAKAPKGTPRSPGINPELEPIRQAMLGRGTVWVTVGRSDEVIECVQTFSKHGIQPVLVGASGAMGLPSSMRKHVRGILPSMTNPVSASDSSAKAPRNRFADLQSAGFAIALASQAEEGAVELPITVAMAVAQGMSASGAVRALTHDAARLLGVEDRVGSLKAGLAADVLLLNGPPLALSTSVQRVWVAGEEVR
ncbi:MAG: amidohydrolase family protein, partial [Myxococcota bacterium]